jgi:ubiquinone/menaquinone biosynthesis C-methylase UbiE
MDAHYPDFKDEEFDLIIASDCLEHLENDNKALGNWNRILRKGGTGLIFVPAFMSLWSEHDVINHHFRRYTRDELQQKAKKAGFAVTKASYWNFAMYFPTWLYRKMRNMTKSAQEQPEDHMDKFNPLVNSVLKGWMKAENMLFGSTGVPLGVSVMVAVKK